MNGKLYIFGIGGTGSRVIKSLVMLAASGVKIDASAIVPIIETQILQMQMLQEQLSKSRHM